MSSEALWYCIKTKPKSERLASVHLSSVLAVECFLPTVRLEKKSAGGKRSVVEALFPGYLFVKIVLGLELRKVKYANGVLGFTRFGDRYPSISDLEIDSLRSFCESLSSEKDGGNCFQLGDEIELVGHLLEGMRGEVVDLMPARNRVKVLIAFLNRSVELSVPISQVFKGQGGGDIR